MSGKVLVFGGTTEGRKLGDYLISAGIPHMISVATRYGQEILQECGECSVTVGRKNADDMAELIKSEGFGIVVDATHPFATDVSDTIRNACDLTGAEYLRLKRDTFTDSYNNNDIVYVDTIAEAVSELNGITGNILLLTGSKNLKEIAEGVSPVSRVYVRVLPNEESLGICREAGLKGKQIIAMQGPFSAQMNAALIKETGAAAILTKESGRTGGFSEKLQAASLCSVKAIVIRNPEKDRNDSDSFSFDEILERLGIHPEERASVLKKRKITLAGIGPGDDRYHTKELTSALNNADIIFGASSVISRIEDIAAPRIPMYRGEDILSYLDENKSFKHSLVLFSGDINLCSGAKKAAKVFEKNGYDVELIVGISSVSLFAKRLGISLEDARVVSAHGRECNVKAYVRETENLIILPSDAGDAKRICDDIRDIADRIAVGYELGTADEHLFEYTGDDAVDRLSGFSPDNLKGKCIIYLHNMNAVHFHVSRSIADDAFIRGKTPMTKEEIRAVSIRKLGLTRDAVLYDIGAGTGSVSVEAALLSPEIKVFSIEKNEEALSLLEQNKESFGADNMNIVPGTAPDILEELITPTHVFIGGSSGNMKAILECVYRKNKDVRVVINCVTAETFAEVTSCVKDLSDIEPDIIQLWSCRYKKVGSYHLADAMNPVYIITLAASTSNRNNSDNECAHG